MAHDTDRGQRPPRSPPHGTPGPTAPGFSDPYTIASNGNQILVPDSCNARVLVFNAFPTMNAAAANAVLGQATFGNTTLNDNQDGTADATPAVRTVGRSYGAWMGEGVMIINDTDNHRYALYVD